MRTYTGFLTLVAFGFFAGQCEAEMTYDSFLTLQEGNPSLTWELLDCVQGVDRSQVLTGCSNAIRRYEQVIAAGDELLGLGTLSADQHADVEATIDQSWNFLSIVLLVRARLLSAENPDLARSDCDRAGMIALQRESELLNEILAECSVLD
ncbi:hypothetical protein [Nioella aestuarii]|uniref:hypothetical protein n=1 Tax=Nioella aestuarii TaxID=1662864 RepID=UPI003D7F8393